MDRGLDLEEDFSHLLSKVNPRLFAGFGDQVLSTELYRSVLRIQLSIQVVDLGVGEVDQPIDPHTRDYVDRVFRRLHGLLLQLSRLDHVFSFLRGFPNRRNYERAGITRDVWVEYHVGTYLSTLSSLADISLLLVNEVHALGIRSEKCKYADVVCNRWIEETPTAHALKELNRAAQKTFERRNADVHRAERLNLDAFAGRADDLHFAIAQFGKAMNYLLPMHEEALKDAEELAIKIARSAATRMKREAKVITEKIEQLLEVLEPVFQKALADPSAFLRTNTVDSKSRQ